MWRPVLVGVEAESQFRLDGNQELDVIDAIPVSDIIGSGAFGQLQRIIVHYVRQNISDHLQQITPCKFLDRQRCLHVSPQLPESGEG
jgi:hypothetical protein